MWMDQGRVRKAVAEVIGTFGIVFFGCGSVMVAERFPGALSWVAIPVVFGLVVAAMVYTLGHISGAHFNPAVTAAFAVIRRFPASDLPLYWVAQVVGAFLAVALLAFLLPAGPGFGATLPKVPELQAFAWEFTLTFLLMFVVMGVATDTRAVGSMAGAVIGATVMLCAFIGGPVTGASMNPARSLAPAIAQRAWEPLWLYFLGPILGAIAAAMIYEWIRVESPAPHSSGS